MTTEFVTVQKQNQIIPVDAGQLIENKPQERLLIKFNQLKEQDLITKKTAESHAKLKKVKNDFVDAYIGLAYNLYELSKVGLRNLSRDERTNLNNLMLKRVESKAKRLKPLLWLESVILFFSDWGSCHYYYCKGLQEMKKLTGDEFFPHEELEETLSQI